MATVAAVGRVTFPGLQRSFCRPFLNLYIMSLPLFAAALGGLAKWALNRADYAWTRRMTSPAAQVHDLREAGLNPALAYNSVQPANGQVLTPGDGSEFGTAVQNYMNSKKLSEYQDAQIQTQKSMQSYYDELARRTGSEADEAAFRAQHQEELYNVDFLNRGMQNEKLSSEVRGIRLHNTWQEIENEIHRIDWQKHDRFVESQIKDLVASAGLKIALEKTENTLRKYKVAQIKSDLVSAMYLRNLYDSETSLNKKRKIGQEYANTLDRIQSGFMSWLTNHGADFSTLNSRQRWQTYGPAIISGVSSALNTAASLIPFAGMSKGLTNLRRGLAGSVTPYKSSAREIPGWDPLDSSQFDHLPQ